MRRRSQMDLITLDTAYSVHIFVKDRTKSKEPAVKRPIRLAENDGSFLEGVFMAREVPPVPYIYCILDGVP